MFQAQTLYSQVLSKVLWQGALYICRLFKLVLCMLVGMLFVFSLLFWCFPSCFWLPLWNVIPFNLPQKKIRDHMQLLFLYWCQSSLGTIPSCAKIKGLLIIIWNPFLIGMKLIQIEDTWKRNKCFLSFLSLFGLNLIHMEDKMRTLHF